MTGGLDRRRFLTLAGLSAGALATRGLGAAEPVRPLRRRAAPKTIAVLGGGMGGLVAAHELALAGHRVTLLEAQRRPGGRVLTLRAFSDGLYAEAGAGRIPDTHGVTLHYARHFGLPLDAFYPTKLSQVAHLGGARIRFDSLARIDMSKVPLELSPAERAMGLDGLSERYVRAALREIGDFESHAWPSRRLEEAYGSFTFAEYLERQGASKAAIAFLSQGFEDDAALDFLRDAVSHNTARLYKIRGGNDRLPHAFARRLAESIRYGAVVKEIRRSDSAVEVLYEQAGTPRRLMAEHVVCALPFSVLRHLSVTPPFPDDKRKVIDTLRYGSVTRVILQTRTRFWARQGLNGFALVDRPMEVWSPSFDQPGTRGLLTAYTYERLAREIGSMPEAERIRSTASYLNEVHPGLTEELEGGVSTCWDEEPFARGAFPLFDPGELSTLPALIRRSEGRIHFAGDHASPYPGWMQGALMAGLAAAREVNEAA
jgi:monoamine oxidase